MKPVYLYANNIRNDAPLLNKWYVLAYYAGDKIELKDSISFKEIR